MGSLLEANGQINVRSYEKVKLYSDGVREETAIRNSFEWAIRNLIESSEKRQGNNAVKECFYWLREKPIEEWRLSFLYDISFLIQRKLLQKYWLEQISRFKILCKNVIREMRIIVEDQVNVLGKIFHGLQWEGKICEQDFMELAQLEERMIYQQ